MTVTLVDEAARETQHNRLIAIREQLLAIVSIEFCLHVHTGDDSPVAKTTDTLTVVRRDGAVVDEVTDTLVRETVRDMLRALVVAPWAAMDSELTVVRGSFECFIPGVGTNMGWHQDGFVFLLCFCFCACKHW